MNNDTTAPFVRSGRALLEWIAHSLLCLGVYVCIQGVRWVTHRVRVGAEEPTFFGVVPIDWIFDGADMMVLVTFGYFGVLASIRAYRGGS